VSARGADGTTRPSIAPRRHKGAALWLALVAMATVSFNMTRVGGWTVSDLLFVACAAVVIVKLMANDERYLTPRRYRAGSQLALAGVLVVITGATLSSFGSWYPVSSMMVVARLAWSSLIWFWILRSVCRDREALMSLIHAWRITILASAIIALLGEYAGVQFNPEDFGQGRQAGLTFHPGELMNFLIAGLFLFLIPVFVPTRRSTHRFATAWWLVGSAVVTLAIFSTGSTSGLLAITVALLATFATASYAGRSGLGRRRTPLMTMSLLAGAALALTALMGSDLAIAERLSGYGDGSSNLEDSIASRTDVNEQILGDFDQYILVGVGPYFYGGAAESLVGGGGATETDYGNIHNMYLKLLYESGLPALVGLWIVIYAVGRQGVRLVVACRGTDLYQVSLILVGGFVAVNTSSMFGPVAYARHFWLPFALIGCLWSVRRRELHDEARSRTEAVVVVTGDGRVDVAGSAAASRRWGVKVSGHLRTEPPVTPGTASALP
jgi:O-antigen ligase